MSNVILTQEGLKKLEDELKDLKSRRNEIAEKIRIAKDFGDLSENAEYSAAREEQAKMDRLFALMQQMQHRTSY